MSRLFSHIIQKRFSSANEDVATDALEFILSTSNDARNGLMELLNGIEDQLPDLHFQTQQSEHGMRPDMWGFEGSKARVFIENKFWAGLTDNQPVAYLHQLAEKAQPSVLLVVAPEPRRHVLWRELLQRLDEAGIPVSHKARNEDFVVRTELGPTLALTSWARLLGMLAIKVADDTSVRGDLLQLQTLCDSADQQAFVPFSREQLTDQTMPAVLLQLSEVVSETVDAAVAVGTLDVSGLRPQASWDRIGRYAQFTGPNGPGIWIGAHLGLWYSNGSSPLWVMFSNSEFGRGPEVRRALLNWCSESGIPTLDFSGNFCLALQVPAGEEKDRVVRTLVEHLKNLHEALASARFIQSSAGTEL